MLTIPGASFVGFREVHAISEIPELEVADLWVTAVNLFSIDESDVAPGDPERIIEMGRVGGAQERPAQPARAEWWGQLCWPRSRSLESSGSSSIGPPAARFCARSDAGPKGAGGPGAMTLPFGFTDPVWLWLTVPVAAIVVVGWLAASRTLPGARRIASLVIRLVLAACLLLSLAGMRLALPFDPRRAWSSCSTRQPRCWTPRPRSSRIARLRTTSASS